MNEDGMKPCPFCGKDDDLSVRDMVNVIEGDTYARAVICGHCFCVGRHVYPIGWTESDEEAIEAWNDRP